MTATSETTPFLVDHGGARERRGINAPLTARPPNFADSRQAPSKGLLHRLFGRRDEISQPDLTEPHRSSVTLEEALEDHLNEKPHRPRTAEGYRYHLKQYLDHLRALPVDAITRQMVRDHYLFLKQNHGETTAASTMRTLKAVINTAMRIDETLKGNPVALYIPSPKRRKVPPLDLPDWWKRVNEITPIRRDLHIAMLLTGARRSSILQVKRAHVDIDQEILTLVRMKTSDEPLKLPMGRYLTGLISNRLTIDEILQSEWLWPSPTSASGRVVEPKEKGLPRPHEYRHYARTFYIAAGVQYAQSAMLLGQKLPGATGAYVHIDHLVEDLRVHAQALEDYVLKKIGADR